MKRDLRLNGLFFLSNRFQLISFLQGSFGLTVQSRSSLMKRPNSAHEAARPKTDSGVQICRADLIPPVPCLRFTGIPTTRNLETSHQPYTPSCPFQIKHWLEGRATHRHRRDHRQRDGGRARPRQDRQACPKHIVNIKCGAFAPYGESWPACVFPTRLRRELSDVCSSQRERSEQFYQSCIVAPRQVRGHRSVYSVY